jgi:hypothetical protein
MLRAAVAPHLVGDGKVPAPANPDADVPAMPYSVVDAIPGGPGEGNWAFPEADVVFVFQVSSVGASRAQAQGMADKVVKALFERNAAGYVHALAIAGVDVVFRAVQSTGGVTQEGTGAAQGLWTVPDRFELYLASNA